MFPLQKNYDDYMVSRERNSITSNFEIRPNFEITPNGYHISKFGQILKFSLIVKVNSFANLTFMTCPQMLKTSNDESSEPLNTKGIIVEIMVMVLFWNMNQTMVSV